MLDRLKKRWEKRRLHRALLDPGVQQGIRHASDVIAKASVEESLKARHRGKVRATSRARNKQARASRKKNR